ncbi:hypothetical protein V6Z11_A06G085200 [Gossypium hirsutum]
MGYLRRYKGARASARSTRWIVFVICGSSEICLSEIIVRIEELRSRARKFQGI